MSDFFRFPRARFVSSNGIVGQALHVESELDEFKAEMVTPDIVRTAEEALDLLHSVETLVRVLVEKFGIDAEVMAAAVIEKNRARGYYDVD